MVFAQPDHAAARELLADTYEQLGYGSENGTWRNFYLSGATELRDGQFGTPTVTTAPDVIAQLIPVDAVRRHRDPGRTARGRGTRSSASTWSSPIPASATGSGWPTACSPTAPPTQQGDADATLTTTRRALPALALGGLSADGLADAGIELSGDAWSSAG